MRSSAKIGRLMPTNTTDSERGSTDVDRSYVVKVLPGKGQFFYGSNCYKWSSNEPKMEVCALFHNIFTQKPGLKDYIISLGKDAEPLDYWSQIFDERILQLILHWTNTKLQAKGENYKRDSRPELQNVDLLEFKAFLGLLVYSAIFKYNDEDICKIFATYGTGREIFRSVISGQRFTLLLPSLPFYNPADQMTRCKTDPVPPISELFFSLVKSSQRHYLLGTVTCVD